MSLGLFGPVVEAKCEHISTDALNKYVILCILNLADSSATVPFGLCIRN